MELKKLAEQVLANAESASDPEGIPDAKGTQEWVLVLQMIREIAKSE